VAVADPFRSKCGAGETEMRLKRWWNGGHVAAVASKSIPESAASTALITINDEAKM